MPFPSVSDATCIWLGGVSELSRALLQERRVDAMTKQRIEFLRPNSPRVLGRFPAGLCLRHSSSVAAQLYVHAVEGRNPKIAERLSKLVEGAE